VTRGRASAAGLALALAGALAAQNGAGAPTDVATRLHEAWLREVLDPRQTKCARCSWSTTCG
jgi:hypothetical protein